MNANESAYDGKKKMNSITSSWLSLNPLISKINLTKHVDDMPRTVDRPPVWIVNASVFGNDCFVIDKVVLVGVARKLHQRIAIMWFAIYCNKCLVCGLFENFPLKYKKKVSLNFLLNTFSLNTLHDVRAVVATIWNCIFLSWNLCEVIPFILVHASRVFNEIKAHIAWA